MNLSFLMIKLGFSPKLKGFELFHDAILIYELKPMPLGAIYSALSRQKNLDCNRIERNIRTLIKNAHDSGNLIHINNLLHADILNPKFPPSPSELIAWMSIILRYLVPDSNNRRHDISPDSLCL